MGEPERRRPPASGRWTIISTGSQADVVRAEPFEALELDLTVLWAD